MSKAIQEVSPRHEHTVPWFWPMAAAIELGEEGLKQFQGNLRFASEAVEITVSPESEWATSNRVVLELDTMHLRDFSSQSLKHAQTPVLVDAPYAGHSSTIADYAVGQSLVEVLFGNGLDYVQVTDWKGATSSMKGVGIDKYLADIDEAVEFLGGKVDLVGLCQGGG